MKERGDPAEFGFLRAAAAVPVCSPADPEENARRIAELAESAAGQGASLVVFPELALSGYTCGDLFLQKRLEDAVGEAARSLAGALPRSLAAVVGAPWRCEGKLFNVALVYSGGRLRGIVPKSFLPNYKEFYEKRWFVPGRGWIGRSARFGGDAVPFGTDLLFRLPARRECLLGIEICEDLWVPTPPSSAQALAGATVLANLSASDQTIGKSDYRRHALVASQSARCLAALVYVSSGPGESSSDLVFGGHALIAENGTILAEERRFQEGPTLALAEIDLDRLAADRDRTGSFADAAAAAEEVFRTVDAPSSDRPAVHPLFRRYDPQPFVPSDPATLDARCEEVANIQTAGLVRRLRHLDPCRPILGLSGGLDSALAALVSARALALLGAPASRLLAVSMPGAGSTRRTHDNAFRLASALGAELRVVDIRKAVESHLRDIGHGEMPDVTFENAQARERMQILMDLANAEKGIVVGTGDLSEIALGFATYGGDHLSMYNVNASVPKTLVRHVVSWFARTSESVRRETLVDILATPVSPELLPGAAQLTEEILGPYELHDFFLYHFLRGGDPPRKLEFLARNAFSGRFDEAAIRRTLRTFLTRFFANQFKRNAMPDGPKVGTVALSPRGDWRMPADVSPRAWLADLES
jgi:NAD+ synthase (glutamine-hydrolysing)